MKFADLLVGEEVDLFEFVVAVVVQVHLAGFSLFRELVEREQVDASSEAVFDVDFVEEGNHVFCLVIGVVEVLQAPSGCEHQLGGRGHATFENRVQ